MNFKNFENVTPSASIPVSYESIAVGDYLDAIAAGDIANPDFQSGLRWSDKLMERLAVCMLEGMPIPPLMVADIPAADGGPGLSLRIDGNQRTAAIMAAVDCLAAAEKDTETAEKAAALSAALLAYPLYIQRVSCPDIVTAARLFCDINSGVKLSGVQSAKAKLSPAIMAIVNAVTSKMTACRGAGAKWGKVNADTAAAMLTAAALDWQSASTSSAGAVKSLTAAHDPAPAAVERIYAAIDTIMAALSKIAAEDAATEAAATKARAEALAAGVPVEEGGVVYGNKGSREALYWATPAHLVPAFAYVLRQAETPSADDMARLMRGFDPAGKGAARYTVAKGKGRETKTARRAEAWASAKNDKTTTLARVYTFAAYAAKAEAEADAVDVPQDVADAAAVIAAAMKGGAAGD